jgi:hypothetical protein
MRLSRSRWELPAFSILVGVVMFGAELVGGDLPGGVSALVIMCAFGALLALGGRSETIRLMRGEVDERGALIDLRATAYTGIVLIVVIIGAFLVRVARGHSGNPYTELGAMAGATYLATLFIVRRRS